MHGEHTVHRLQYFEAAPSLRSHRSAVTLQLETHHASPSFHRCPPLIPSESSSPVALAEIILPQGFTLQTGADDFGGLSDAGALDTSVYSVTTLGPGELPASVTLGSGADYFSPDSITRIDALTIAPPTVTHDYYGCYLVVPADAAPAYAASLGCSVRISIQRNGGTTQGPGEAHVLRITGVVAPSTYSDDPPPDSSSISLVTYSWQQRILRQESVEFVSSGL